MADCREFVKRWPAADLKLLETLMNGLSDKALPNEAATDAAAWLLAGVASGLEYWADA
jgi:hypothetical protein